jgi:hypothetical protein
LRNCFSIDLGNARGRFRQLASGLPRITSDSNSRRRIIVTVWRRVPVLWREGVALCSRRILATTVESEIGHGYLPVRELPGLQKSGMEYWGIAVGHVLPKLWSSGVAPGPRARSWTIHILLGSGSLKKILREGDARGLMRAAFGFMLPQGMTHDAPETLDPTSLTEEASRANTRRSCRSRKTNISPSTLKLLALVIWSLAPLTINRLTTPLPPLAGA